MSLVKVSMIIDTEDIEAIKKLEHHAEYLLDLDSYPEIKNVSHVEVEELNKKFEPFHIVENKGTELELEDEDLEFLDTVYNSIYDTCKLFTENENLEYDMGYIGYIADTMASELAERGNTVKYPAVVTEENGNQYIEKYLRPDKKIV